MTGGWQRYAAALGVTVVALLPAAPAPALAQEAAAQVPAHEAVFTRWFVEMKSPPTADGTNLATVRNEKAAFRRSAAAAGLSYKERYAYDVLWNGLSIEVAPGQASKLWRIDGVKAIYPVEKLTLPETTPVESPDLATALGLSGADIAQSELGLTGAGIRVAVMDTGVDYHHPDLGGCFGPGCRVATGWDFVGDKYNANPSSPTYDPEPKPDADPDDCNGHGTHVAGIIGANGNPATGGARGVAPGVTFGAYRVFGCDGSTDADIMIAAMERALADGMHVLNMSIGSSFQWPQYPTAQASDRLVNKGVTVVASIGNSGTNGTYAAGAPGVGAKVIGVASFDNTRISLRTFTISPDGMSILYNVSDSPMPPTSGSVQMARTGTTTTANDGCNGVPHAQSVAGRVALIRRGTCSFYEKARNAQLAGAVGVVLYNNTTGRLGPTVAGSPAITIPVVAITSADGATISGRLTSAGAVTMTWTDVWGSVANATAGLISSFSSYGLAPDLSLKPDIGAPGGFIRSTYPLEKGGYESLSGTSMSSPHTAGGVALLLEARPNTPPNAVRTILQNSADPKNWQGNPSLGFLDQVHRQGAGMLDIPGAIAATTRIEPAKLALGESESGPATRTLTVTNRSGAAVTYDLSHAPALATGPTTFTVGTFNAPASAAFSILGVPVSSLAVPAGGSATVDVTITAPAALAERGIYGGYVVFTPQGGGAVLRVPYAGLRGDYQTVTVLTPTANGFPWLARLQGGSLFKVPTASSTFTLANGDVPYVLLQLGHQSRTLRIEVLETATGKSWHRAMELDYVGRNAVATGTGSFFALSWDGTTVAGNRMYEVPNGTYILRMSVLKPLGDAANPAHWETWDSPALTIARPPPAPPAP